MVYVSMNICMLMSWSYTVHMVLLCLVSFWLYHIFLRYNNFLPRNCIWQRHPQNSYHFISSSLSKATSAHPPMQQVCGCEIMGNFARKFNPFNSWISGVSRWLVGSRLTYRWQNLSKVNKPETHLIYTYSWVGADVFQYVHILRSHLCAISI